MAGKRAVGPEDLYELTALAEPQLAPGSQLATWVVISVDREQDGYRR
ncbi:hypothetical protein [Alicyclobacillus ferrooxydans]|nr:hypothetical protein [Alicyclobacillus ferrooxydans]